MVCSVHKIMNFCPSGQDLLPHHGCFPWEKKWQESSGHLSLGKVNWPLDCNFSSAWSYPAHSRAQFCNENEGLLIIHQLYVPPWFYSLPRTCWSGMEVQELCPEPKIPTPRIWATPIVCLTLPNQTLEKVCAVPGLKCTVGRALSDPTPRAESLTHQHPSRVNISGLLGHFSDDI